MLTRLAFLTLSTLPFLLNAQNTFYQPDEFACLGNKVEMKCYVQAPSSETFSISVPLISFDDSDPYTMNQINFNTVPNRDTSRYNIEQITTGETRIGAKITISSFVAADSDILFGCHGRYYNGTDSEALASGHPPKTPSPPDQTWPVNAELLSVSYDCIAEVSIEYFSTSSDAYIQYYELYINGELSDDRFDLSIGYFKPAHVSFSVVPATTYKISVAAVSCAGTGPVSDVDDSSTFSIPSLVLDSSLDFTLNSLNGLVINWNFQEQSDITIAIEYNLEVDTSFQLDGKSTILNQTLKFSQTSDVTSYTHNLELSVITENEIDLAITVKLGIASECDDRSYAGTAITKSNNDLVLKVAFINNTDCVTVTTQALLATEASKAWVVTAALSVGLLICSVSTVISILVALKESSRRRSAFRKLNYTQLVTANEQAEPLLAREEPTFPVPSAPTYSINTLEQIPSYEMSNVKI